MVDTPTTPTYSPDFLAADAFVAAHEGSEAVVDSNGYYSKFGINQKAHPEVPDVRLLTAPQAQAIRYQYWKDISGDVLAAKDPRIASMAYDTAILAGPNTAKQQILMANGDPAAMYQVRVNFLKSLASNDPKKNAYLDTWMKRTNELAEDAGLSPVSNQKAPTPTPTAQETPAPEPTPIEQAGSALEKGIEGATKAQQAQEPVKLSPLAPVPAQAPSPLIPKTNLLYQSALARSPSARAGSASAPAGPAAAAPPVPPSQGAAPAPQETATTEETAG